MEDILRKLQKDASGHKHKALRDACVYARGECTAAPPTCLPPRLSQSPALVKGVKRVKALK